MSESKGLVASIAHRGWSAVAALATLWFVSRYFSAEEQGYYFSFASLLTLQVIFELGFSVVLVQFVAHEAAFLKITGKGVLEGSQHHRERLESIAKLAIRWYGLAGIAVLLVVTPLGWSFFAEFGRHSVAESWQMPWVLAVLGLAGVITFTGMLAVLEGLNQIHQVASLRLGMELTGYGLFWLGAWQGLGLAAFALLYAGRFAVLAVWLLASRWTPWFHRALVSRPVAAKPISWRREILPFQWRIGVSWLAGFFIFNLFSPIAFAYSGPVAAGQLGATLALFNGVTTVAMIWVGVYVPSFAGMVARAEFAPLWRLFKSTAGRALLMCALGCVAIIALLMILDRYEPDLRQRFLPPDHLPWLLPAVLVNQVVFSIAALLRCEKKEPMLWPSIVAAAVTIALCLTMTPLFGVKAILASYSGVNGLLVLPMALKLLFRLRNKWLIS